MAGVRQMKEITLDMDVDWIRRLPEVGDPMIGRVDAVDRQRERIQEMKDAIAIMEQEALKDIDACFTAVELNWTESDIVEAGGPGVRPRLNKEEPKSYASLQSEKIGNMAALTADLKSVVDRMLQIYIDNDWLNDLQPAGFEAILPLSLDEWSLNIDEAAKEWEALARNAVTGNDEPCPHCEDSGKVMASDLGEACGPGYDQPDRLVDCPCGAEG